MRGPPGTKLRIGVTPAAGGEPTVVVLERKEVKLAAVTSTMAKGSLGVVRVKQFSTSTADDVKKAVAELREKGAKSIALDLRGNTGGYFNGGVDTARLFLSSGKKITFVTDRTQARSRPHISAIPYGATPGRIFR